MSDEIDFEYNPYTDFKTTNHIEYAKDFELPGDVQGYDNFGKFGWITLQENSEIAREHARKILEAKYGVKFD